MNAEKARELDFSREEIEKLRSFYQLVYPGGPGWKKIVAEAAADNPEFETYIQQKSGIPEGILAMVLGCFSVYSALFATGYWLYGQTMFAVVATIISLLFISALFYSWKNLKNALGSKQIA